jgi:hypothetical protein
MKTLTVVGVLCLSILDGRAQPTVESRTGITFAPNVARTVTVTKGGVRLASFEVPAGILLSIRYPTEGNGQRPTSEGRFEVHGDIEIRLQAAVQRDRTLRLEQAMSGAPVALTAQGVELVVSQ